MDKQQKLQIALPVLAVVLIIVWGPMLFKGGSKKDKEQKASVGGVVQSGQEDLNALSRSGIRSRARTAHEEWGKNPFVLTEGPKKAKSLTLEGIMWDAQNPTAMIDGNFVVVGDKVGPNTVVAIGQNSVTLKNGDKEFTLNY